MARVPVHGQPDPDFWGPEPLQTEQEEDLQRPHGSGVRLSGGLLPRHEVIMSACEICSWCDCRRLSCRACTCKQPADTISLYLLLDLSPFLPVMWCLETRTESWTSGTGRPPNFTTGSRLTTRCASAPCGIHTRPPRSSPAAGTDRSNSGTRPVAWRVGEGLRRCGNGVWPELVVPKVKKAKSPGGLVSSPAVRGCLWFWGGSSK